ncbi:hypothetical protein Ahy_A10g048692 [Arachis hypogaea]|uniref:Protein FAR1-RELATED SEQUENCE n=1 Tax=Arachis hypogaea TaxID=3818 RepID=A0A445B5P1_ARAHY|nr:hypothetical protein Ahy_A10g048692 [Arachis hypogaea]
MECDMVGLLGYVPSTIGNENSSNLYENVADHFVIDGEQSNKVMQLSDVTEVESEKMDLDYDIRTTTCDKITKKPVNQAIHCNRNGFRGSRVKVPTRKNTILAPGCKARIYVTFDKDIQEWILFKIELRYSHPCLVRKVVHYHEYRELTMHAKCVIEDNDEAEIRPNKIFLALANEAGSLDINMKFFYAVKLDEGCKFRSVVWVEARCRASYEYYGDVVSVDSIYSTNSYEVVKLKLSHKLGGYPGTESCIMTSMTLCGTLGLRSHLRITSLNL